MIANYHTHTYRCNHAGGTDRKFVEAAIEGGLKILGFADHCPWVFPVRYVPGYRMQPSQLDGYFTSLTDLKKEYEKDIKIYIGFESEYIPELMEAQDKLLADYPVDYMILGQHSIAPEYVSAYTGAPSKSEDDLKLYVDLIIEGLESGRYRYAAHPDLFNFIGDDEVYIRHYTRLCRYLKEKDIPVEINLLGLRENRHYPNEKFFRIAEEIGNKAIIGCDAHFVDALKDAEGIEMCRKIAEKHSLELVETLIGLE